MTLDNHKPLKAEQIENENRYRHSPASICYTPILLDLFCGAGGCSKGYVDAGFKVVGVDHKCQKNYPYEFIQADALEYVRECGHEYDAIHASPPCQAYIQRNKNLATKWPKLIDPLRHILKAVGKPYIIENVEGAPLENPLLLCGTMFDLLVRRHRLFEVPTISALSLSCNHWGTVAAGDFAAVYAFGGKGHRRGKGQRDPKSALGPEWSIAMGIDWMTKQELTQAIPPAYTHWIGKQILESLRV